MTKAASNGRSGSRVDGTRLVRALAALEREGGERAEAALAAFEAGDPETLANVLSTTREEAERLIALLRGPSAADLDADAVRWASGVVRPAFRRRRWRRFLVAVATIVAGATVLVWNSGGLTIQAATVALQPSRQHQIFRLGGPELYCPGEPIRLRLSGSDSDLASVLILLQHETDVRALAKPARFEDHGVLEVEAAVPPELANIALDWSVWIAHARREVDLPAASEISRRLQSPPRDGAWRLVPASPPLRLVCPSSL